MMGAAAVAECDRGCAPGAGICDYGTNQGKPGEVGGALVIRVG